MRHSDAFASEQQTREEEREDDAWKAGVLCEFCFCQRSFVQKDVEPNNLADLPAQKEEEQLFIASKRSSLQNIQSVGILKNPTKSAIHQNLTLSSLNNSVVQKFYHLSVIFCAALPPGGKQQNFVHPEKSSGCFSVLRCFFYLLLWSTKTVKWNRLISRYLTRSV